MESSKNKTYTAADIERYHSGQMPAAEMHALEKAAMDDPFLSDAIEGYALTSTPSEDLQKIQKRLEQKTGNRKVIAMYNYNWLKIAAVLLVVAGGGWLAFSLVRPSDPLAVQTNNEPENSTVHQNKVQITDTVTPPLLQENITAPGRADENTESTTRPTTPANAVASSPVQPQIQEQSMPDPPAYKVIPRDSVSYPNVVALDSRKRATEEALSMNNANEQRSRMAMPDVNAVNRNRNQADNNYIKQDQVNRDVARNMETSVDTIRNVDVVMKKSDAPPAEVVVLSRGNNGIVSKRPRVIVDTLEPADGWARFDDYIAANIKAPEELKSKDMLGGEVQLSFDVNKKGQPVNIAVVKSLCEKCDEEAIRLLKEGPKWKKQKNRKGRITIRF
ncbi:MAG TPA: energy transducer TonB [Flavisolibacter sp.]